MTTQTLSFIWPLAPGFDRDHAMRAAEQEIEQITRTHQLKVITSHFELIEPGRMYGTSRWHLTFTGTVQPCSHPQQLPIVLPGRPSPDVTRVFADVLAGDYAVSWTPTEGLRLTTGYETDRWLTEAPAAEDDDLTALATIHHLPVGATG